MATREHVILWAFRVRAGCEAEFEKAYSSDGAWARLFARAEGYLGSELLQDAGDPRRYCTIDRWSTPEAFARFCATHAGDYAALDDSCELWTESELPLGAWSSLGD